MLFADNVEPELLHTYSKVYKFDVVLLIVRLAVLTAVTLTVPVVLFPVSMNIFYDEDVIFSVLTLSTAFILKCVHMHMCNLCCHCVNPVSFSHNLTQCFPFLLLRSVRQLISCCAPQRNSAGSVIPLSLSFSWALPTYLLFSCPQSGTSLDSLVSFIHFIFTKFSKNVCACEGEKEESFNFQTLSFLLLSLYRCFRCCYAHLHSPLCILHQAGEEGTNEVSSEDWGTY